MINTSREAIDLVKKADQVGISLSVGFVERFNPAIQEAKKIVDRGEIGEVLVIHAKRVTRRPHRVGDIGVVKDLRIHDIDVTNFIMDKQPKKIYATMGCHNHCFEDYANIIEPQGINDDVVSCYNYYTVKVTPNSGLERDQIVQDLFNMHIEAAVHYPRALTQQPALDKYISDRCPVAEELAENVFSIPIHPYLTDKQKELVVLGLRTAVNRYL